VRPIASAFLRWSMLRKGNAGVTSNQHAGLAVFRAALALTLLAIYTGLGGALSSEVGLQVKELTTE
jgi:hypothetical protein